MIGSTPPAPGLDGRLAAALDDARDAGFVGRDREVASFTAALDGAADARVLLLHGPGGIGKSSLLDALSRRARAAGRTVVYLDARDVVCSRQAVAGAIAERTRSATGGGLPPDVLLVDGYELLAPLDRWFREELLPARPQGAVTVLAGRAPPAPRWWLDPGWRHVVRVHELDALDAGESRALLARLGVPGEERTGLVRLGRGHPLLLALLAEAARRGDVPAELADAPEVVAETCRLVVDDVPDDAHRTGLATCAHATRMTEDLLGHVVGDRAGEVWRWLESRPYVRRGATGLFLHDVVREVFETEFRHRAPAAHAALHLQVGAYFAERIRDPATPHPDREASELVLMHRHGPLRDAMTAMREREPLPVPVAGPEDQERILEVIERTQGPESAAIARRWVAEQPHGLYRARSATGVEVHSLHVRLGTPDEVAHDRVAVAILRAVAELGPLRPGEHVHVNRFHACSGDDPRDPLLLYANSVADVLEWARRPAAWAFVVTTDPEAYGPSLEYLGLRPLVHEELDGRDVLAYGGDRRRFPVASLFALMARREVDGSLGPPSPDLLRPAPLSRPDFAGAVRTALRDLSRPDRLAASPLLTSAVLDPAAPASAEHLRSCLVAEIGGLGAEHGGAQHRRVLERTYVAGAPSQEAAAEVLGLPFSTYRRHLARAQDRLVEVLWSVEIGERPPSPATALLEPVASGLGSR